VCPLRGQSLESRLAAQPGVSPAVMATSSQASAASQGNWFRRYGILASWIASAAWTVSAAHTNYGFISRDYVLAHPELYPFPWPEIVVAWVALGVEALILHLILDPPTFSRSLNRLTRASAVCGIVGVLLAIAVPTDMRGHYYVPVWIPLIAACVLGSWAISLKGLLLIEGVRGR
jgi:hypothetical protein